MSNRRRGKDFELEVVHAFKRWFPDACRGLQYQGKHGMYPPDVMGTPFYIECKRRKRKMECLDKWFKRAVELRDRHHPEYDHVLLVYRLDYGKLMVVAKWSTALSLNIVPIDGCCVYEWKVFAEAMDEKYARQVAGKE